MTDYADDSAVEQIAKEWSDDFLHCRSRGHLWRPLTATFNERWGFFTISEKCTRCKGTRHMEQGQRGQVLCSWWYEMPDGYSVTGVGIIAGSGRDVLRRELVTRVYKVTSIGAKQGAHVAPHSASTKAAVGYVA